MNEGIEYFKSLRNEIHLRIAEHRQLVWIKVIVLGLAISFWIKECIPIINDTTNANSNINLYFICSSIN